MRIEQKKKHDAVQAAIAGGWIPRKLWLYEKANSLGISMPACSKRICRGRLALPKQQKIIGRLLFFK